MDALMKIDGDKVRVLRERKAWSQEHLATVSGLSADGAARGDGGQRTLRALGVVGAFAGISAGLIGVLNERFTRRQSTA